MTTAQADADLAALEAEYNFRTTSTDLAPTVEAIKTETRNLKRNAIANALNTLGGSCDLQRNALNYSGRNADVLKMNEYNLGQVTNVVMSNLYNKDLTRRQAEINDWYYQDKLETLFFLQLFFMTLLSMSIIYYFNKSGLISTAFTGFLTGTLFIVVGITGFYRYLFTSQFRDSRWWYKRRFRKPVYKEEKKCGCVEDPYAPPTDCPAKDDPEAACISGLAGATPLGLASVLSRDAPTKSSEPANVLDRVQNQLNDETIAYLQGKQLPTSTSNETTCDRKKPFVPPGSTNVSLNRNVLPYI